MSFFEFLKRIDFFGKEPEFYFQGKPKKVTIIGRIFTFIYIILYIIMFGYKLYRMTQRVDITFYDSYSNTDEVPKMKITDENFSLMFAIYDEDGLPYIDETIYYPIAYYFDGEIKYIDIEICDPKKMPPEFIDYFGESEIEYYYCLNNIDYELEPFKNNIRIEIFPCESYDEDEDYCEPDEVINEYLNNHLFMIFFRDIQLTPLNFTSPVKDRVNFLNTEIYHGLGQYLHMEMQLVKIETSTNIIGFDFLTEPKTEQFIKFEHEEILPYPGYNLFDDEENFNYAVSIFELQLNDRILLETRSYIQLIDVLGEIGGLMEIFNSFFGVICSLIVDIIYEKTMTNDLFSFNIDKKLILLKKVNNNPMINLTEEDNKDNKINIIEKKNIADSKINSIKTKKYKKKQITILSTNNDKNKRQKNITETNNLNNNVKIVNYEIDSIKESCRNFNKNNDESKNNKIGTENANDWIIENISLTDIFISMFYCCCKKNKRNAYKILINESMNVVTEKLDIFNIFRNICSIEYINYDRNNNLDTIKMSEECSKDLSEIIK